jgi:acyl-coenzyme A synthetase/AMP-(fatty) acid ligase/acyl carrier protein
MDSPLIAKQEIHERHSRIMASAVPLPIEIMEKSLVTCFEEQVARHGERVAVHAASGTLTYAALNAAANQLAGWLVQHTTPGQTPVAIVLGAGVETIVALLGVLKAGCSYVLLEPDLPVARLAALLSMAHATLVLTRATDEGQVRPALPDNAQLLRLEECPPSLPKGNLGLPIAPDRPARLQFTSGSTGTPKPILKTHRQKLYSVWQYVNSYHCGPDDRHALTYRPSSNAASRVIFNPLLSGGALYLYDGAGFTGALAEWIDEHAITTLYLPTVALRELLTTLAGDRCLPSVRIVHVGGQTIHRRDAELFQQRMADGAILACRYAMGEVGSLTHFLIDRSTQFDTLTIPAGYALPGRELIILDEDGHDLGYDRTGEIAVRRLLPAEWDEQNDGLAQALAGNAGYDGQTDLFRTADLGLLRPDGCLLHLGRKDDMVKVRGNRVALAEAERLLLSVTGVAQATIKPFPTPGGDNRLVGYVTPAPGAYLALTALREEMSRLAPTYMVPARFVVLPALPLTTSGKVDRQALLAPGTARPPLATPFVAPGAGLEQQIADIWAELLGFDEVGIDDNFFELGGDSLTSMRMAQLVEQVSGRPVPTEFFAQPTIRRMAAMLEANRVAAAEPPTAAAPVQQKSRRTHPWKLHQTNGAVAIGPSLAKLAGKATTGERWIVHSIRLQYVLSAILGRGYGVYQAWARLLFSLCSQPWYQQVRQGKVNTLREFLAVAAIQTDPAPIVQHALMADLWQQIWGRNLGLLRAQDFRRICHVTGAEHLHAVRATGRGVIFAHHHALFARTFWRWLADQELPMGVSIFPKAWQGSSPEGGAARNVAQLRMAEETLRNGGVAHIMVDGYKGKRHLTLPFLNKERRFLTGFGELALLSGAAVLPVATVMMPTGHLTITIGAPFDAGSANEADTRVQLLVQQYVTHLEQQWRAEPANIGRHHLATYLQLPVPTQEG